MGPRIRKRLGAAYRITQAGLTYSPFANGMLTVAKGELVAGNVFLAKRLDVQKTCANSENPIQGRLSFDPVSFCTFSSCQ